MTDLPTLVTTLHALRGPAVPAQERQVRSWLKAYQRARLAATHAELLASPRYAPAAQFFLDELYGPKDVQQRDADVARVLPKLMRLLPQSAVDTLHKAVALDVLSESLDADLAACLVRMGRLRHAGDVDAPAYAVAYRQCGRAEDRARQLAAISDIGQSLDRLTRWPLIAAALKMMKGPAERAGLSELHRFLHGGYTAFAHMQGADDFLRQITEEERRLMLSWLQLPSSR